MSLKPWEGYTLVRQPWRTIAAMLLIVEAALAGFVIGSLVGVIDWGRGNLFAAGLITLELVRRWLIWLGRAKDEDHGIN